MRPEELRARWLKSLRGVVKSEAGKEVLYELLAVRCGVLKPVYLPGIGAAESAYLAGRQSIGLALLDELLEAAPESYMQMMISIKERNDRERESDDEQ